jgi:hypothetical protein
MIKNLITLYFLVVCNFLYAQGVGANVAKDSMAIVGYLELSNIGSRDNDCRGTQFETSNVNAVIDTEITDYLKKLASFDKKSPSSSEFAEIVNQLKQIPKQKLNDKFVLNNVYEQKKQEAITTYGKDKACSALSAMFRTVVQQKRLSIRDNLKP